MNNSFDFNRFCQLVKWNLITYKQLYLKSFGSCIMLILFPMVVVCDLAVDGPKWFLMSEKSVSGYLVIAFFAFMVGATSSMFKLLENDSERMNFLMVPASNAEKFLMRFVLSLLLPLLMFFAAMCVSDLVHMAGQLLFYQDTVSYLVHGSLGTVLWNAIRRAWVVVLFGHAVFTYGSIVFRRHQFLLTALTIFAFFMLMLVLVSWGTMAFLEQSLDFIVVEVPELVENVGSVVLTLLSLMFYYLSYRKFVNLHVKNTRIINCK